MAIDWNSFGIEQGSSVDTEMISRVQQLLAVRFPESYLDLVMYADEASPEIASFVYGDQGTCISEFFRFAPDPEPYTLAWYSTAGRVPGLAAGTVPIARDAAGYLICLNFTTHTVAVEVVDPDSRDVHWVANTFDDFVGLWSA